MQDCSLFTPGGDTGKPGSGRLLPRSRARKSPTTAKLLEDHISHSRVPFLLPFTFFCFSVVCSFAVHFFLSFCGLFLLLPFTSFCLLFLLLPFTSVFLWFVSSFAVHFFLSFVSSFAVHFCLFVVCFFFCRSLLSIFCFLFCHSFLSVFYFFFVCVASWFFSGFYIALSLYSETANKKDSPSHCSNLP